MEADAKDMGGHLSHEYHYLTSIGEQSLHTCSSCGETSVDSTENEDEVSECPKCNSKEIQKNNGIEVILFDSFNYYFLLIFIQFFLPTNIFSSIYFHIGSVF